MIFEPTSLEGVFIINPKEHIDERGCFTRIFCREEFTSRGIDFFPSQISVSLTKKLGTIRGMHFQKKPYVEGKVVTCIKGSVFDVIIDLRKNSKTFGKWTSTELNSRKKNLLLIPKGFAHGFQTFGDDCEMLYFISTPYSSAHASGIRWDDPFFNIKWPIKNPFLSEKDKNWPLI